MNELERFMSVLDAHTDHYVKFYNRLDQLDILQEECAELIQALSKFKRKKPNARESVIEEMSHVLISCKVVARILNISGDDILNEVFKKDSDFPEKSDEQK